LNYKRKNEDLYERNDDLLKDIDYFKDERNRLLLKVDEKARENEIVKEELFMVKKMMIEMEKNKWE
jgi:hypothetical protein